MEEQASKDVQALEKISNEADESQIKVILTSQYIKAQAFLLHKLKKQTERHKEIGIFINSANLKVQNEIKQAEQEIRSMLIAQDTLKSAKVELKKEWLLAKNRKADVTERVTEGIKKYEAMWLECKNRHESIPFVQKLLQATEKKKIYEQDINNLDKEITKLYDDMEIQRKTCAQLTITRAVELANFIINERPNAMKIIKEKSNMIKSSTHDIEHLMKEQDKDNVVVAVKNTESSESNETIIKRDEGLNKDDDSNLCKWEDDPMIPKLNLINFDLDIIDVGFDQVKIKKDELFNNIPTTTNFTIQNIEKTVRHENTFDYMISPYFNTFKEDKPRNYSGRKLINILEDIKINNSEVHSIVKKVNPEQLRLVGEISAEVATNVEASATFQKYKDDTKILQVNENIEEIELSTSTSSNVESILIPPTQFLDMTLSIHVGDLQDDTPKKRVCFDLPSSMQISEIEDDKQGNEEVNESINQTMNSPLDASTASDESFKKMKEILLKKHNLDLSPQFVYAKKNNELQKKEDDIVTSKFFKCLTKDTENEHCENKMEIDEQPQAEEGEEILELQKSVKGMQPLKDPTEDIVIPMDVDKEAISSPLSKEVDLKTSEEQKKSEKTVTGLLFTHGSREIPDSLNVSLSTNGYEDSDFPHCIDSSLLLSPKADVPANIDQEASSQEVPNFLSGFRKTGFSFFGGPSTSFEPKPESNEPNEGNFSFNFGGEKKNRGGLFSLFR